MNGQQIKRYRSLLERLGPEEILNLMLTSARDAQAVGLPVRFMVRADRPDALLIALEGVQFAQDETGGYFAQAVADPAAKAALEARKVEILGGSPVVAQRDPLPGPQ